MVKGDPLAIGQSELVHSEDTVTVESLEAGVDVLLKEGLVGSDGLCK